MANVCSITKEIKMKLFIVALILFISTVCADYVEVSSVLLLGYMPGTQLSLYEIPTDHQVIDVSHTWTADYQATARLLKIGFVTGGMTCYSLSTGSIVDYYPIRMDFDFGAGLRHGPWEIGWYHGCYHPIAPNCEFMPLPRLDASQNLFYIKVKIGKTDR
jgi:hypothetical protein